MEIKWSPLQSRALSEVSKWQKDKSSKPFFYLAGSAGSGKTTLARHFAESIDGRVFFGAYTGKAAHVLRQKGCHGAMTIHSMIYTPSSKKRKIDIDDLIIDLEKQIFSAKKSIDGGFIKELDLESAKRNYESLLVRMERYKKGKEILEKIQEIEAFDINSPQLIPLKKELSKLIPDKPRFEINRDSEVREAQLILIDEASMVDDQMADDLLSFGVKILVLGDPYQLPPVGGSGFFTKRTPDFLLDEIHRQERDNPIIQMAHQVKNGIDLAYGSYGESRVIEKPSPEDALKADQMLVGTNEKRVACNKRLRQLLGYTNEYPVQGDKIVCLKNNNESGLLNGSLWNVISSDTPKGFSQKTISLTIESLDGLQAEPIEVNAYAGGFLGSNEKSSWWDKSDVDEFTYGYALTVHKAQGSQWENVLVFDQSGVFKDKWARWLYTAITRASRIITVVR